MSGQGGAKALDLRFATPARVFEIDPNTVLGWLVEAAEQLQAFSAYFLHDLPINQVQLDELYAVLSAVRDGDIGDAETIERLSRSPHWVWAAIDPETTLLLHVQGGERTLAMAQVMLHQIAQLLAPGCVPLFLSDGYPNYLTAIVTHFGCWVQPPRRQARGPAPKPRWMPLPALLYAQVVKTMRRRRIVEVKHRVIFGTHAAVDRVWTACGWQINTAFVERLNLSLRQRVAAIRRRSATSCKSQDGLGQQLTLFQVYHNFVLPHTSAPSTGRADSHQRYGLGQGVAAVYAGDGGGIDRSCVDVARGVALSGATVAPAADGLRHGAGMMIVV